MAITPDKQIIAHSRHNDTHKLWEPDHRTRRAFMGLPRGWYVFVAELIHSKVVGMRNINYINDILVADSEYLVGTTFEQRQDLLQNLFPTAVEHISGHYKVIDEHTWLAENYDSGFSALFGMLGDRNQPEDEGIVLKNSKAELAICSRANSNSKWQKKCRLLTKNFAF